MDIVQSIQTYVKRMFSPDNTGGAGGSSGKMKVLLLDSETVSSPNRVLRIYVLNYPFIGIYNFHSNNTIGVIEV